MVKKKKKYNYLRYPGLTPKQMNDEQFKAWDDYIDNLACQVPTGLSKRLGIPELVLMRKKNKVWFNK